MLGLRDRRRAQLQQQNHRKQLKIGLPATTSSSSQPSSPVSSPGTSPATQAYHMGFTCHGCGATPIVGDRHRSLQQISRRNGQSTNFCGSCICGGLGATYTSKYGPFKFMATPPDPETVFGELGLEREADGAARFQSLSTSDGVDSLLYHVLRRLSGSELGRLEMSCQLFRCSTPQLRGGLSVVEHAARTQIQACAHPAIVRPPSRSSWKRLLVDLLPAPLLVLHPPACRCCSSFRQEAGAGEAAAARQRGEAVVCLRPFAPEPASSKLVRHLREHRMALEAVEGEEAMLRSRQREGESVLMGVGGCCFSATLGTADHPSVFRRRGQVISMAAQLHSLSRSPAAAVS